MLRAAERGGASFLISVFGFPLSKTNEMPNFTGGCYSSRDNFA